MKKLTDVQALHSLYSVPAEATAFLSTVSEATPNGKYEFGDACYVAVMSYVAKTLTTEMQMEAHERYIDVQYLATGEERILYTDKSELAEAIPYDAQKDVAFYDYDVAEEVRLKAGEAVILDTDEAHLPSLAIDTPVSVKKAVLKLKKVM